MSRDGILLKSGTNEFEFVEFMIDGIWYGINVAKINEIIRKVEVTESGKMHASVRGVFDHRGSVIPLVDLSHWLGRGQSQDADKEKVLICELNGVKFGFLVHSVSRIKKISWIDLKSPQTIISSSGSAITGVVKESSKLILMLDIEKIVDDIDPSMYFKTEPVHNEHNVDRSIKKIWFADDSVMLRKMLKKLFKDSGYQKVETFKNGGAVWKRILEIINNITAGGDYKLNDFVDILVTDLEMPQIDGLNLIKRIKEHPILKKLPIVVFTSMSNEQNKRKALKLGANNFVHKPKIQDLLLMVDSFFK